MSKLFDLKVTFNEFLEHKNVNGYMTCISCLEKYLSDKKKLIDEDIKVYFQGIRSEELIKSVDYYIDINSVTSYGAVNRYVSCLKEYFLFLVQNEYLKNDELIGEFAYKTSSKKSYRYKVNEFIKNNPKIIETQGFDSFEEVEDLIHYCDEVMENEYYYSKVLESQMYFNKYRSALIIKLILLTGVLYRTLITIKRFDLDLKHNTITINDLTIHLPNRFLDQMEKYLEIRHEIIERNTNGECDSLFIEFDSSPISDKDSTTINFLRDISGRGDLNGIIKYAIINMIRKGINQSIIVKFTGVGDKIYSDCQSKVNREMDLNASRYLDSKIRSIKIFDML